MRVRTLVFLGSFAFGCGGAVEGEPYPDAEPLGTIVPAAEEPPIEDPPAALPPVDAQPPVDPPTTTPRIKPRVVLVHSAHGTAFDNWVRSTDRYDFELGPELAVLGQYRDQMTVFDGFDGPDEDTFGLGAYDWGPSFVFTGETFVAPLAYGDWHRSNRPARASLDRELNHEVRFRTFATAFAQPAHVEPSIAGFGTYYAAASARDLPVAPSSDVRAIHQQLTANVSVSDPTLAALLSSLADWMTNANLDDGEVRARAHAKLIAAALATDQARGVVYQATTINERFAGGSLNVLAHWYDAAGRSAHDAARLTIARRVKAIVDELAATPFHEGGTLLDHTIVVWVDDTGFGYPPEGHSNKRLPIVWIGELGGRIASGQYLRSEPGRPYIDMLRTLAQALELDPATLGEPFASATPVAQALP